MALDKLLIEKLSEFEAELIRLNQAADLAERLYVDGLPQEYVVDSMIEHARNLRCSFEYLHRDIVSV